VAEVLAGADQFAGVPSSVDDILAVEKEARARANAIVDKL
ncbi:MAG TPA: 1-deoxy-D-xylulose-5-phosphate reductoisomerase, partial [Corynebacterium sp.]|nr:1-deoxy-D-xylulose-5-phosphate reductoisomerase [Corynebacterium sp.]